MLKPEQIAQLRDLVAESNRLLELGDKQGAEVIQQRIEALKAEWRKADPA
ncbi:MAG: hypothetical protein NW220_02335 [Leptolyngbyaceae cyanobacterium bins.349]|nr:hypothetical protein [Leptolyngbyaceae cyanobacterium bins.349]